jgi:uncharacterized lipoprotein YajG
MIALRLRINQLARHLPSLLLLLAAALLLAGCPKGSGY